MSLQASIHATAHDRYRTSGIWRILYRSGRPAPRGGATSPAWPVPAACGSAGSAASPPSASPSDRRACQQPVKMCTLRPVATGGGYIPSHCCKHSYPTVRQPHPRLDGTSGMRWTFSWRTERCGRPRLFPACYSRPARCCRLPAMPRTGVGAMSGAMSVAGPMGRGHGDRDRGWDRHHGDEGRGPVDIDRRADRDRPGRWAKGDRIPRNTASANISSTTGAPTTWPRRRAATTGSASAATISWSPRPVSSST